MLVWDSEDAVTAEHFRRMALSFPEATEGAHMSHPDFRVSRKIFATLNSDETWGVVMLTPEQQKGLVHKAPTAFVPVKGAWGRRGCTQVLLRAVKASALRNAMTLAWLNKAPKKLAAQLKAAPTR